MKGAAVLAASSALGPLTTACGGTDDATTASGSPSAAGGKKGGILRVGMVGGRAADTADPNASETVVDDSILWMMYEGLMEYDTSLVPQLVLAEEVTPNADATKWTVRLKPDLLWSDATPLTADDVVFTMQRIVDPKNPLQGAPGLGGLKPSGIKKVDELTTEFTWDAPNVLFGTDGLTQRLVHIAPKNFDPQNPVGSGPWKMTSFKPGQEFVYVRNENYHGEAPYLDGVTVVQFQDATARLNALLDGQIDAMVELPSSQIGLAESSGMTTLRQKCGAVVNLCMNTSLKPYNDPRVRKAFRLIVDRQQVLSSVYSGAAWLANDMWSPFDPGYPKDIPQREQDLEQAKALLKQAGYDNNLTVELVASDVDGEGAVPLSQVFSEQAKGAGVNVKVRKVDAGVKYGPSYPDWPFSTEWWAYRNYLQQASISQLPDAPWNSSHWNDPKWTAIVKEALQTADDAKRNELVAEAEAIDFADGGYITPTFRVALDAYSSKVAGFVVDALGVPLGRYRFNQVQFK